ncbi:MAG: ATP synthase F1 subunit delta [Brumimicrobium sp.]|nr:ATP synthase F1 subunit delta [Brumimicrobium sp.]
MEGLNVARRYAQSLIELSNERNSTEIVLEDMKTILVAANENRDFRAFLNSPLIKEDKKANIFDKIFTGCNELTHKFNHLLIKNKREYLLPLIAEQYIVKVNEQKGIVPVILTSATELSTKVREDILAKLSKNIQGTLELKETIDPSLIGGFVVKMGDTKIDASVAHQLAKMKQQLLN